jgi:hypothetical protein
LGRRIALAGGKTVATTRDFIPRLVDLFMAGGMPLDRLITRYEFADINRVAADATSGAAIKKATPPRPEVGHGPTAVSREETRKRSSHWNVLRLSRRRSVSLRLCCRHRSCHSR